MAIVKAPGTLYRLCCQLSELRSPRFSLLELMIIVAILGLVCSVPCQFQRDQRRQECLLHARICADHAEELTIMANYPGAWMDEFRPGLRQRAAWAMEDNRRFSEARFYDAVEDARTGAANAIARKDAQFWARFKAAAVQHGYSRLQRWRCVWVVWSIDGFLVRTSPTYFLIILLACALWMTRRSRQTV